MKKVMKNKRVVAIASAVVLVVALLASGVIANPLVKANGPSEPVASQINYQGQLTDNGGTPYSGAYGMEFRFWNHPTLGSQVGSTITKNNVTVTNGLFNVKLDVDQSDFNGQGLWLEVNVEGEELTPRQQILPAPYAMSLKPGAVIKGALPDAAIEGENTEYGGIGVRGRSGFGTGVRGEGELGVSGQGSVGPGVEGRGGPVGVQGISDSGGGVSGSSTSGVGVTAASASGNLIEAWDTSPYDRKFYVENDGDVHYDGALIGAFPRPAWDSGWVSIAQDEAKTFTHNLGSDPDDYFVDLCFKDNSTFNGINQRSYGGQDYGAQVSGKEDDRYGAYWRYLTANDIVVYRRPEDTYADWVRVRIWVYK